MSLVTLTTKFPGFFNRWRESARPILAVRPELHIRDRDDAAREKWESEGGAVEARAFREPKSLP